MQNRDEGTIKYRLSWQKGHAPVSPDLPELIAARNILYKQKLIGVYENGIGYGNVSCRYSGHSFVVSGTQTGHLPILNEEHFTLVTDCDPAQNTLTCTGPVKASSEAMTHYSFYDSLTDINCVLHVHHSGFWKNNLFKLPTTAEGIAYGTPEMAGEIKRILQDTAMNSEGVIIMAGHEEGIFFYGLSVSETFGVLSQMMKTYI